MFFTQIVYLHILKYETFISIQCSKYLIELLGNIANYIMVFQSANMNIFCDFHSHPFHTFAAQAEVYTFKIKQYKLFNIIFKIIIYIMHLDYQYLR